MFQLERLKVVSETLEQINEEVQEGKIDDCELAQPLLEASLISLFQIARRVMKEAENEDS